MSEEKKTVLARRAVACPGWRWMPGMLARAIDSGHEARITKVYGHGSAEVVDREGRSEWGLSEAAPDLDDPATLGCLLALVREAWSAPQTYVSITECDWAICWVPIAGGGHRIEGDTEAEALVAALEAAARR